MYALLVRSPDLSQIDLNLLHTFRAFAKDGSVTGVAKRLGRSQPAISARLRALEEDLGVPLFRTEGRNLRLTPEARTLERHIDAMFIDLERALHSTRGSSVEPSGILRIGALATVGVYRLTPIVAALTSKYPMLHVHLHYGLVRELTEALRRGHLDAAAGVGDPPEHGLDIKILGHARPVLISHRRLGLRKRPTLVELRQLSWASFGPVDDRFFGRVSDFMRGNRLDECVRVRVGHIQTLMELVRATDHAAIVPDYTVNSPDIVQRSLRGLAFEEPIWLAARGLENPAVRALFGVAL